MVGSMTVQLHLGDCLDFMRTLPDGSVDAVVTDPPYDDDYTWVLPFLESVSRKIVLTPGKIRAFDWIVKRKPDWEYIWKCNSRSFGGSACMHIGTEPILAYGFPLRPLGTDLLGPPIGGELGIVDHPWPKPLGLITKLVSHWSNGSGTILDPFMGSGTTGVVCANLGRKFIGIEIEERYFNIACERIRRAYAQSRLPLEESEKVTQGELIE